MIWGFCPFFVALHQEENVGGRGCRRVDSTWRGASGRGVSCRLMGSRGGCTTAPRGMLRARKPRHNSPPAQTGAASPSTHSPARQVHPSHGIQAPASAAPASRLRGMLAALGLGGRCAAPQRGRYHLLISVVDGID